jgi:hypothetical protein
MILAILTLLLFVIAWWQLGKISKTSSADFIHKFKIDFFTEDTRKLIMLVDKKCLIFKNDFIPYFEVRIDRFPDEIKSVEVIKSATDKKIYTGYEVDDFLLGHFEDLGILRSKGIIDIDMIYESFDWYIEKAWENEEIQKYIEVLKKEEGSDIYENFRDIYNACRKKSIK